MIDRISVITGTRTDPYANLALELYLTETVPEGTCRLYLWQNRQTVVIGRNQNAVKECRSALLEEDGGYLARRLSGGGAVYHDSGNLNFTFCVNKEDYDLGRQQSVLLTACRLLGIDAEISGRNDLTVQGRKFSGNSFYSHKGKSFHNGTILIDVDQNALGKYLNPSKAKLVSKSVDSVRSRVINLKELVPDLTVEQTVEAMTEAFGQVYGLKPEVTHDTDFTGERLDELTSFFGGREWNYGASAPADFSCTERFGWGELTLELIVRGETVSGVRVYTDSMDYSLSESIENCLSGVPFGATAMKQRIHSAVRDKTVAADLCGMIDRNV